MSAKNNRVETQGAKGDTFYVDLMYPRCEGNPKYIDIYLCDVRAADGIRISYDFERDGWVIEQASRWEWPADDPVCDPDWQEVAFVKAWARDPREQEQHAKEADANSPG